MSFYPISYVDDSDVTLEEAKETIDNPAYNKDSNYGQAEGEYIMYQVTMHHPWPKSDYLDLGDAKTSKTAQGLKEMDLSTCGEDDSFVTCTKKNLFGSCPSGWFEKRNDEGKLTCSANRYYDPNPGPQNVGTLSAIRKDQHGHPYWVKTDYQDIGTTAGSANCQSGWNFVKSYIGKGGRIGISCSKTTATPYVEQEIGYIHPMQPVYPVSCLDHPDLPQCQNLTPMNLEFPFQALHIPGKQTCTNSAGLEVDCTTGNDTANIAGCGVPGSYEELNGWCTNTNTTNPNDLPDDNAFDLTEYSLSTDYLIGVAVLGIPIGYYCNVNKDFRVLYLYLGTSILAPMLYDKVVEYVKGKRGDTLVAVALMGVTATLGVAVVLNRVLDVPAGLCSYVGLGGLVLTGGYTAYVAFEEGYVKDIITNLFSMLPDLGKDIAGGIWGGITKIF